MTILWIDFETRSRCDLRSRGVYNYAQDASTDVLCMSYAFDDEDVRTWLPGQPFPPEVAAHDGQIRAHNAAFERLIFWYVLQIDYRLEQFYCTAAQARANCAPGSLEDVGRFAGASMKKDHRGSQLIRLLSIPQADGGFREDAALMAEMVRYCESDVRAMRAVSQAQRALSADELADYHTNERINDRGVLLDKPLAEAAVRYAEAELVEIQDSVAEITGGEITSVRSPKMRAWVLDRVGPQALKLATVYKDGVAKLSIDKTVRANLLALAEENPDEVPADVAEVIQCADDLWASSVAKFNRAAALADAEDRRVRGAFVFAGGSATGRASSFGLQVHNFPRKCAADPALVRQAMVRGHQIVPTHGKRVTDVLKGMLRPSLLAAPGKVLVVADWAAIEARVTPWASNTNSGAAKLDIFAKGEDVYKHNAMATFHVGYDEVDKDQRQIGKVQELACGFAGGVGAFASMGRIYNVVLTESESRRMVDAWRRANSWSVPYWQKLEHAYTGAMRNRGQEFSAGRVTYLFDGQHLWYVLPSSRVLCYPFARFDEEGNVTYAKAAWKPAADAKEWPRARLWRGLACIAEGTPVLTKRGWVSIERVTATDMVWDGEEWVAQQGAAYMKYGRVLQTYGVTVTPDHLMLTTKGWVRADQIKGYSRAACRIPDGYEMASVGRSSGGLVDSVRLRRDTRDEVGQLHEVGQTSQASVMRMPQGGVAEQSAPNAWDGQASCLRGVARYARSLRKSVAPCVAQLWRARDYGMCGMAIIRRVLGGHGFWIFRRAVAGPQGQQRGVFSGELPLGHNERPSAQPPREPNGGHAVGADSSDRNGRALWGGLYYDLVSAIEGCEMARTSGEARRFAHVYDLINCGPRKRFVVMGADGPVIVHNCENITQAVANDLLRHTLRRLEDEGLPVVLHIHDEVVLEVPEDTAEAASARLVEIMCQPPAWASGLPLNAEVATMAMYGK